MKSLHLISVKYNPRYTILCINDDQWSNIIGGVELVRRSEGKDVYGMTFNLLTNSEGKKMGKTEKGAVWLDKDKMSPYDFFQYWRNIGDNDVIKCLKFLTFLPIEEIEEMEKWEGEQLNKAKEILAFDLTKTVHGEEEAQKALDAARAIFVSGADTEHMPSTDVTLTDGAIGIIELLKATGLAPSNAEARRLIQQGGLTVDGEKVTDINYSVKADAFEKGHVVLKKGKKVYHKVKLG
ncbi:MAG: tyrosine--tRNA ligase [Oscillospiraceae bacterium]|nr:tyrosine--tRNA ligase [Oscillospiraceae bacterium]